MTTFVSDSSSPSLTLYLNSLIQPYYNRLQKSDYTLVMDNSSLSVWEECNRKFLYKILLALKNKDEKVEITFGTAYHKFLELHHSGDYTFQECFEAFCKSAFKVNSRIAATRQQAVDSGLLQEYSAEFGYILCKKYSQLHPLDKEYFIILRDSENKPYTETGFALDLPNGILIGLIDGIASIPSANNKIIVVDHKTTKYGLTNTWFDNFNPNNQMSKYLAAASEYFGQKINTALINAIRVKDFKRGDPEENTEKLFGRIETYRSDEQLELHLRHANYQLKQINNSILEGLAGFPMETNSCHTKYGECEYRKLCMARSDFMIQLLAEGQYVEQRWSPYEVFEDSDTQKVVEVQFDINKAKAEKIDVKKTDEFINEKLPVTTLMANETVE